MKMNINTCKRFECRNLIKIRKLICI